MDAAARRAWINEILGVATVASIGDVSISAPASGEALVYNGTDWANQTVSGGGGTGNIDGGTAGSTYGAVTAIDAGGA